MSRPQAVPHICTILLPLFISGIKITQLEIFTCFNGVFNHYFVFVFTLKRSWLAMHENVKNLGLCCFYLIVVTEQLFLGIKILPNQVTTNVAVFIAFSHRQNRLVLRRLYKGFYK